MKILVINTGSSSIKYQLIEMEGEGVLASGLVERIGESSGRIMHSYLDGKGERQNLVREQVFPDHRTGLNEVLRLLTDPERGVIRERSEISGVGHRVVHGGEDFQSPVLIDERVKSAIHRNIPLAPLHNPPNLLGIEVVSSVLPGIPQVAVFDTAFHQTLPPRAFHYGLPYDFYKERKIRRYGFHGSSHKFVATEAARLLGRPLSELNLITIHLGNGSSITAIEKGRSVDTSMGMTPLEGLLMGTRAGDLDPAIYFYLAEYFSMSIREIESLLNTNSGLKGLCGTNDMREVLKKKDAGDPRAELALELYAYRIKKYIGAYLAALGYADAIVFTAGVGENAPAVRALALSGLERLGIILDPHKNQEESGRIAFEIHAASSLIKLFVIPTNEELQIARETAQVLRGGLGEG